MIMPKDRLSYLGNCLRIARKSCKLTQQQLADDSCVAIKTIQNIEKGLMNPSYEVLFPIIRRLGISADILFYPEASESDERLKRMNAQYNQASPKEKIVISDTVDFLSQKLSIFEEVSVSENNDSK